MNPDTLIKYIAEVKTLVLENKIFRAVSRLKELSPEYVDTKSLDRINSIEQTYRYMVHYFLEGAKDDSRRKVTDEIANSLYCICGTILRKAEEKDSPAAYFSALRTLRHKNADLSQLLEEYRRLDSEMKLAVAADAVDYERTRDLYDIKSDLFNFVWTMLENNDAVTELREFFESDDFAEDVKNLVVAALTLSLMQFYDATKIRLLIDVYNKEISENLCARTLVALILAFKRYDTLFSRHCDPKILVALGVWEDSIMTYRRLRDVIKNLVSTIDTERINDKMRNEVIPELMRLSPDIMKKMRESGGAVSPETFENNPEWEEMLERSGLADKFKELNEMQSEGADMMMVTFSNLKSFPFFNQVAAWFMPCDINSPDITLNEEEKRKLSRLFEIGVPICESDKYSLVFAFEKMPAQQRDMILTQFDMQLRQVSEEMADRLLKKSMPEFDNSAQLFVRELYRFFKLYRNKAQFYDPYGHSWDISGVPVAGTIFKEPELTELLAEFYFRRGIWTEALKYFGMFETDASSEPAYWEKIGFCHQNNKDYISALEAYSKSELLKTPGLWLLKRLGFVNRKLGNYRDAAQYYERVMEKEEENFQIIMDAAICYMNEDEPSLALPYLYHAFYLKPENSDTVRSIVNAEYDLENYDKALSYLEKITDDRLSIADLVLKGNILFLKQNIKEAHTSYCEAMNKTKDESGRSKIREGILGLVAKGVDRFDVDILLDSLWDRG